MNSLDCIIAAELKFYDTKLVELKKKKLHTNASKKILNTADEGIGDDPDSWNVFIRKTKTNSMTATTLSKIGGKELVEMWNLKYSEMNCISSKVKWTKYDEKLLKLVEEGKIECFEKLDYTNGLSKTDLLFCGLG